MDLFLQQVFNGVMLGSTYAIVALGLTLVFGILNVLNHKNELNRIWDIYGHQYLSGYMWETVPYFGLEFEF